MVQTLHFHTGGTGLMLGQGTTIQHAELHGQKEKKKNKTSRTARSFVILYKIMNYPKTDAPVGPEESRLLSA